MEPGRLWLSRFFCFDCVLFFFFWLEPKEKEPKRKVQGCIFSATPFVWKAIVAKLARFGSLKQSLLYSLSAQTPLNAAKMRPVPSHIARPVANPTVSVSCGCNFASLVAGVVFYYLCFLLLCSSLIFCSIHYLKILGFNTRG